MAERDDRSGTAAPGADAGVAETLTDRQGAHPTLPRGTTIHRYVVLEQVGSGAMGVVYAAYDVGLDRRIALKVLRDPRRGGAHRRLVREAQTLAKLSHPGVVAVYDVGTYRDQVFVAMEFVAGRTVRAWLDEAPRSWREVLDVYTRAGEGLAAAHAAGIVHRDFKPDNVLIDVAGRVRVGDFGLALVDRGEPEGGEDEADADGPGRRLDELTLTRAGAAVGTPAYMAPEQRGGDPVDARADQYSFCVALHEALYGYRPLAAGSEPDAAPAAGATEPVAQPDRQVPARVRRAIQRGLAESPDERYPSMDALLAEVGRDPSVVRRRAVAVVAVLAVAAGAVLWLGRSDEGSLCRGAAGKLAGVWDPARKQAVAAAFRRSGSSDAGRALAALEPELDRHARGWTAMHTESCEATHVRGDQPADLLDLRTQCLDQRLSELRALTDLFLSADAATVAKAAEATSSLGALEDCANVQALRHVVAPPSDAAGRVMVERLRSRLAAVKALYATAKWKRGVEQARGLVADARELGYRPLEAEALVMLGALLRRTDRLEEAEETIYDAIAAGEAGRNAEATADGWLELVWLVGAERGRYAEALRLASLARGVIEQLGGSAREEARLARSVGHLYVNLGKLDQARPYTERALAMYREIYGPDDVLFAESLQHMGILEQKMGRLDEALRLYRRAHQIADRVLGPDHPATLSYLGGQASVRVDLGRHAEGLAILERSLAPLERATGPRSGDVLILLTGIGTARRFTEDYQGARTALERALMLARELYGPDHVQVARIQIQLGRNFTDTRQWARARAQLDAALALMRAELGPDHPDVIDVIEDIARVDIESGRPERAIASLERALTVRDRTPGDPYRAAFCRFELARALHRSGRTPTRVRQLVESAWRGFQQAGDASSASDMKRWLDAPGMKEPE